MARYIPEILKEINDAPDVLAALKQYVGNEAVKYTFAWNFIPKGAFLLPPGKPPFTPASTPLGASKSNFANEVTKFHNFLRTDMKAHYRERLFIQLLEDLHPSEAEVLVCIKDQCLRKLYPNITLNLVVEAGFFPYPHIPEGYVIYEPKEETVEKPSVVEQVFLEQPVSSVNTTAKETTTKKPRSRKGTK